MYPNSFYGISDMRSYVSLLHCMEKQKLDQGKSDSWRNMVEWWMVREMSFWYMSHITEILLNLALWAGEKSTANHHKTCPREDFCLDKMKNESNKKEISKETTMSERCINTFWKHCTGMRNMPHNDFSPLSSVNYTCAADRKWKDSENNYIIPTCLPGKLFLLVQ